MFKLSQINEKVIESRGLQAHEPHWLRRQRLSFWQQFKLQKDPDWRRSKIPKIDLEQSLILQENEKTSATLKVGKKGLGYISGKMILSDGKVSGVSLKPELAGQGVIFCDMKTAVLERADLLEKYLVSKIGKDKFTLLHLALWENGYFLFIPNGLIVSEPFQVQIIQKENISTMNRNIIVLDAGSEALVEEVFESGENNDDLVCFSGTEIFSETESHLKYYSVQNWGKNIYDISNKKFFTKKNAGIKSLHSLLGGRAGTVIVSGEALESGASIEHNGITIGNKAQNFKISADMNHWAENTVGMMRYKSILKDNSYSFLDGLIKVAPPGKKASSRLEEHTIILGDKARCDALPALDIQTSDVQVSHSASVTKADAEKIFYVMSRGLSEEEAHNLIIQGFFANLLELIEDPSWHEKLKKLIEDKLFDSSKAV